MPARDEDRLKHELKALHESWTIRRSIAYKYLHIQSLRSMERYRRMRQALSFSMMKKTGIEHRVADSARLSKAAAKDKVDEVVYKILKNLREGKPVKLPGMGKLVPGGRPKSR